MTALPKVLAALLLLAAAVLQVTQVPRVSVLGAAPDILVVTGLCLAARSRPAGGATAGFFSGLLVGSLSGATTTAYCVSRTLAGFGVSSLAGERPSTRAIVLLVVLASLFANLVLFFVAPKPDVLGSLGATILSAAYNGVVAWPVSIMVQKLLPAEPD